MPNPSLQQVIRDIKSLKIQGAEAVAESAVKVLKEIIHSSKPKNPKDFTKEVREAKKKLFSARPTEPYLRNSLTCAISAMKGENAREMKETLFSGVQKTLSLMKRNNEEIVRIGSKKIRRGMVVFTHCHSSTVTAVLKEAKKRGVNFSVHNTETRPRFQGRTTAKELSDAGISVTHFVDSAGRLALKGADMMLIGADAITSEGRVINKIGSELFAEIAQKYDIPVYVCTNSWKFDPETIFGFTEEIEERSPAEVWKNPPKRVKIDNHAFEIISPELITGVITEIGIFEPRILVTEIRRVYEWMIRK